MRIELVVEDELSEAVLRKVLTKCTPEIAVATVRLTNGFGELKKNLRAFNSLARVRPVLILTDQDTANCAPDLIKDWFADIERHAALTFRVATREVESWVMADRARFARFLGVQTNLVPPYPDQLVDPKASLVQLASASPSRAIKKALVPRGATARIGPGYNATLCDFVFGSWDPDRAQDNSDSLRRAIASVKRIRQ